MNFFAHLLHLPINRPGPTKAATIAKTSGAVIAEKSLSEALAYIASMHPNAKNITADNLGSVNDPKVATQLGLGDPETQQLGLYWFAIHWTE